MTSLARYFQQNPRQAVATPLSVANQGQERIGQGISQLAADLDVIQERDELFWVQKQMADIDGYSRDLWETTVNNAQDGAPQFEQQYLGGLESRYDEARNSAPSTRALRMLDTELLGHRTQQSAAAQGFATEEKYQYRRDVILQEADNLGQEMFRFPSVDPYSPTSSLTPPSLPAGIVPADANTYYSSGMAHPHTGEELAANLDNWESRYYAPQDFGSRDGTGVMVSRRSIARLDWVTDQFGYGKLQINSGYRSPEHNESVSNSGTDGGHTKGEAFDIQVRDLPQAERNRLYSLFRAAGANAFGFGEGLLHVEWRDGAGSGRDGDFEWTYGSAAKYDRVPVAGPGQAGGPREGVTGGWQTPNQYPFLNVVSLTAANETGTTDLASASLSVANEANGSVSYGALGLNSNGMLPAFVRQHGEAMGLSASAGSPEFTQQWQDAVRSDPEGMIRAQLEFHQDHIVRPAQAGIVSVGAPGVSNDPRAVAFASDLVVQYGATIAKRHMEAGAGARDAATFINAVTESTRRSLDADFATTLASDPNMRTGLVNRIDNRARDAMGVGQGGMTATGNVPAWNGPVPNIEQVPGYSQRMNRIDQMVDSMGGTPDQRRDLKAQLQSQVTRAWLTRVAEVNPPAAMSALMSGRYDQALQLSDTTALYGSAQSSYARFEAEIRQNQRELIENLRTEAQSLLADEVASVSSTGESVGMLTDSHMAVLSDKDKSDLAFARFEYETARDVTTSPANELPAILEALEPSGEGFAEEQRRYNFARELVEQRMEQQQNDPAGMAAGSSQSLMQTWTGALDSADPQKISAAIRAIRAKQRDLGVPEDQIQSIPQGAMSANQDMMENAEDADQAFAMFMEMRGLYGSEFGAVVDDMERAGLNQGWRQVNELIDSGNVLLSKQLARVTHAGAYRLDAEIGVDLAKAGQQEVARMIFDGRLRRENIPNLLPTGRDDVLDESVLQTLGRSMGDAFDGLHPETTQKVREAALSVYAAQATLGEAFNAERLEESVGMVTGGVLEWNGSGNTGKVIPPVPGMTQAEWNDIAMAIGPEELEGAFIGYATEPDEVNAGMIQNTMQFVTAGNGIYYLRWPGVGLARNEAGEPFELDLSDKLDVLRARGAEMRTVDREQFEEPREPYAPDAPFDPFMPGGVFDNFDPETGAWQDPGQ